MIDSYLKSMFTYNNGELIRNKSVRGQSAGKAIGSIWVDPNRNKHKYKVTKLKGKEYKLHRLIWCYHNGQMPDGQIDHINGNSLDNRIENLRVVNNETNSKNRCIQSNNTVGYHGITMHNKKYRVRINFNKKRISCGVYDTFEEALAVRKQKEIEYGYHKNHGRINE